MKFHHVLIAFLFITPVFAGETPAPALQLPATAPGPFQPSWESLEQNYQAPEWFRDAKFGIWAHWGPQCEPEQGDWYARRMYDPKTGAYKWHVEHYGHPSKFGFKDVIHEWKAANFDPDKLLAFYKANGARYFMALANHHDNFDLFDSKYQEWNSVAIGPKKDLIAGWAAAARKNGLRFGVSVHASRAWSWYETAQGADTEGPYAGIPYDGRLAKADGKGQWWEGLDPQELYAQSHVPGTKLEWSWDPAKGSSVPDAAYMEKFFKRVKQLWDDYQPDQIYFDDSVLPFHGVNDEVGLQLAAHFYNSSIERHGRNEAVMNNKGLQPDQRKAMVYDIERGKAESILPQPWQTDTCIGSWHYEERLFREHKYKSSESVIRMLIDIVSKNGNLMLSVPLQRDGTPDTDEMKIVSEIGAWLKTNGEGIYATRPWKIYGEGPSTQSSEKGHFDGQKDVQSKPFTPEDVRFTCSKDGKVLYFFTLAEPSGDVRVKSLGTNAKLLDAGIENVRLLGGDTVKFDQTPEALIIHLPSGLPSAPATGFAITQRQ